MRYRVVESYVGVPGNVIVHAGETVELDDEAAAELIAGGLVEATGDADTAPADNSEPEKDHMTPPPREAALDKGVAALLSEGDREKFTRAGKPKTDALEAAAGLSDVSAAERDAAWERRH